MLQQLSHYVILGNMSYFLNRKFTMMSLVYSNCSFCREIRITAVYSVVEFRVLGCVLVFDELRFSFYEYKRISTLSYVFWPFSPCFSTSLEFYLATYRWFRIFWCLFTTFTNLLLQKLFCFSSSTFTTLTMWP